SLARTCGKNNSIDVVLTDTYPELTYIYILWRMYSKIADKVGVSFADNSTKLIGVGIIVNLIVAFVIDIIMSFIFFLKPFVMYFQFYASGKLFIETLKKLK
ncbi:MAG: hypothetical protein K2N13_03420, partial [Paraprevotella sp.]|nr:hypothetical protein [Paraprevotella sp.]